MSAAKHTPGPWRMQMFRRAIANDEVPRIYSASGYDVAEAISKDDARLIAAAPELLAIVQEVFVIGDRLVDDVYGHEFVQNAKAAIAKAGGQA